MKDRIRKSLQLIALVLFLGAVFFIYEKFDESMIPELDSASVPFAKEIILGVRVDAASYERGSARGADIDTERAKREVELIAGLGADAVRIDLEKNHLQDAGELEKLDRLMDYIRKKEMKVLLAYQGRESWSGPGRGRGAADWEGFKEGYKGDVVFIVERYKPEYLVILPGCPYEIGRQVDAEKAGGEWFEYAKEVGLAAKQISFATEVILEGALFSQGEAGGLEFAEAALGSNDIAINAFSLSVGSVQELEKGVENLLALKKKYHWEGKIWMGNLQSDFGSDTARQEDFLLYSLYLANSNGFSGVIVGNLADDRGDKNGIVEGNYAPKDAYRAIQEVLTRRDRLFYE